MIEKVLAYGLTATTIAFIIVQIFVHLRKKRFEEYDIDKKSLVDSLLAKKNDFSFNTFPIIRKYTLNQIKKKDSQLIEEIKTIIESKKNISSIKNSCDLLITRMNKI